MNRRAAGSAEPCAAATARHLADGRIHLRAIEERTVTGEIFRSAGRVKAYLGAMGSRPAPRSSC